MKNYIISILSVAILAMPCMGSANGDAVPCRKVVIGFRADRYWTWRDLGEDPMVDRPWRARVLERYFVGDHIMGRLFIGSNCMTTPLSREVLTSIPSCISLEVYDLELGENGRYRSMSPEPLTKGSIGHLKIDSKDSWNKKNVSKKEFLADDGHFEGLNTEYFDLCDVIGKELPAGSYLLNLVADSKCKYHILLNSSKRWIRIFEPDTPKLKAYKLCREAGKMINERKGNINVLKKAISEKIMPALEIDPRAVCAFAQLSNYYWLIRNFEKFKKYYKSFCDGQSDKEFKNACLRGLKHKLNNWDNPKWRSNEAKRQGNQVSASEADSEGGLSNEVLELCRKGSKILSQRKRFDDRVVWKKAVNNYFLPALDLEPQAACALDVLVNYYLQVVKDREKFIEYSRRRCDSASGASLRQACPSIRPPNHKGSCQDATEKRLREYCYQFIEEMIKKQNWHDRR